LLNGNNIEHLLGFPPSDFLEYLDLSSNPLASLRGLPVFPKLKTILVKGTPFAQCNYHRVALVLACPTLTSIDGLRVSRADRKFAKTFPEECRNLARLGWNGSPLPPSPEAVKAIHSQLSDSLLAFSHDLREKEKHANLKETLAKTEPAHD
jgi:Leucine-rich repeat (LRR) protein